MDRLTQTVDRLREEIDMFETQCAAQLEETKAAQKALSEATTEIEVSGFTCEALCVPWSNDDDNDGFIYVYMHVLNNQSVSLRFLLMDG